MTNAKQNNIGFRASDDIWEAMQTACGMTGVTRSIITERCVRKSLQEVTEEIIAEQESARKAGSSRIEELLNAPNPVDEMARGALKENDRQVRQKRTKKK